MVKTNGTTRQAYEDQMAVLPYNARNLRAIRAIAGISRAAKGVGEAVLMGNVLSVSQYFHRNVTMRVQHTGKKTIKQHHAKDVCETNLAMHITKCDRLTKEAYDAQMAKLPYNVRNLRTLRSLSGIDRASKGVGEAVLMGNVLPVCRDFHRRVTMAVQKSGKKTIKQHHVDEVRQPTIEMIEL